MEIFAILVLLSAFLIEGIGTYVSVVGLSALFAQNPVIIILAIALDIGKVVTVSFLYKYWKKVNLAMKAYMVTAAIVLMVITSTGCFGYLSGQFQKAISNTNQDAILVTSLQQEQVKLQHRKEEIDAQIAKLPDNVVRGRRQLMAQFKPETDQINSRLAEIDKQLPQLKIEAVKKNVDVGPIIYIAQAFDTDPEHAVKWVILIIIFVFDPLAIALLIAGNFLIAQKNETPPQDKTLGFEDDPEDIIAHDDDPHFRPHSPPVVAGLDTPVNPPAPAELLDPVMKLSDEELHAHLGRHKPKDDVKPEEIATTEDFAQPENLSDKGSQVETLPPAPPAPPPPQEKPRDVIQMKHIQGKSQLEDIDPRHADVVMSFDQKTRASVDNVYKNNR